MKNLLIALGVVLVLGFMAFGWYQSGYNRMISLDEQVKSSWGQVENQLQRRFDLIPNLVNTVKGYAEHEQKIFEEVARLRSQWAQAANVPQKVETANALSSVLSRLLAVSENYPQLKANENFLTLQTQLEGTENRISVERMRYNEAVQAYNAYQRSFLGRFFASQSGVTQPAIYFKSDEQAKANPQVKF